MHCVKLTGKSDVNWCRQHAKYYRLWNERAQNIVGDNNFHLGVNYTTWSFIQDTRGGCPYVLDYYFSFFNNTAQILITNYYFNFFNNTALFFFLFMWQQTETNNILNLVVANQ